MCGSVTCSASTATATPPTATNRPASHHSISRRRSTRSATTPAGSRTKNVVPASTADTSPARPGDSVVTSTSNG
jgi:hypothetical protein